MATHRLITIPPSHYCEKARWALLFAEIPFEEEGHAPLVHWPFVMTRTRTRTVPVLLVEGRPPLTESSDIVRYASARLPPERSLYPEEGRAEVEALEQRFDRQLGPATRRLGYCYLAKSAALFGTFIESIPSFERNLVELAERPMRALLGRAFNVSDRARDRMRAKVVEEFAYVESLLEGGKRYLVGDRFSAADLTFTALAAPALGMNKDLTLLRQLDPGFAELAEEMRATRAGRYATDVYANHRPV